MIGGILGSVLPGVLDKVIEKITNQLPVSETEKANIKVQAEKELANHAGAIAEAEATISTNAKDVWLEELHNGGFLATTWRPLLAVVCTAVIAWDGIVINLLNATLNGLTLSLIQHTPHNVTEVCMYILLTLIGARGIEKISVVNKQGKEKK